MEKVVVEKKSDKFGGNLLSTDSYTTGVSNANNLKSKCENPHSGSSSSSSGSSGEVGPKQVGMPANEKLAVSC